MGKCIELTGRNLSASDVCNIARGLCKVSVSTEAIERLVESRKLVFELSDKGVPIYGCNRGVGWNKDKKVTKEFVSQFNKNMKIIDDLYYVLAVEGIHAAQAMNLRGAHYGKGTQAALKRLRGVVPFYSSDDRVLTDDIEAIHDFLKGGGLLADQ